MRHLITVFAPSDRHLISYSPFDCGGEGRGGWYLRQYFDGCINVAGICQPEEDLDNSQSQR